MSCIALSFLTHHDVHRPAVMPHPLWTESSKQIHVSFEVVSVIYLARATRRAAKHQIIHYVSKTVSCDYYVGMSDSLQLDHETSPE